MHINELNKNTAIYILSSWHCNASVFLNAKIKQCAIKFNRVWKTLVIYSLTIIINNVTKYLPI